MGECGGRVGVVDRGGEDGGGGSSGCRGTEEREVEHEVSDCEV